VTEYAITFARSARRELEKLERPLAQRILAIVEEPATQPRPPGCRKLQGGQPLWRLRVGDYRIVYGVDDNERVVDVVEVRHRREAYR
jgi:mRNA interferase RelE/StbE